MFTHTNIHTHTRKHTHRHKHTGIIKSNDKNSLQAYFIWRFPHILVILFRAVDKIGSDISLLMPFTICRLTTSLFPSYPFSLSLPPSSLSQLQHLVSLTPSHNRSSPLPPPHPLCLSPPSQSSLHPFLFLSGIFPHFLLSSSIPISRLYPSTHTLPQCFISLLCSLASFHTPPPSILLRSFFSFSVTTSSQTLHIFHNLSYSIYPTYPPPGLVTINRASRGFHNGLLYLTLLQRHYWPYFSLLLSFVMHTQ